MYDHKLVFLKRLRHMAAKKRSANFIQKLINNFATLTVLENKKDIYCRSSFIILQKLLNNFQFLNKMWVFY